MDLHNQTHIAFIGFGEVGRRFSRDLATAGQFKITAYDRASTNEAWREKADAAAEPLGVQVCDSMRAAIAGADIVFSAVTADQTRDAAQSAATFLAPGQIYVDVNSASPKTKADTAAIVAGTGAIYIETAVMAPVLKPGLKVPCLIGGPSAAQVAERLEAIGMNVTPVAAAYGKASAIKLCRSIMIKGLEALIVDCSSACRHWSVESEVYASLAATFPSIDWPALADDMSERVATHGIRRSAEMREAADMLSELGRNPELASAVAAAQYRGARAGK